MTGEPTQYPFPVSPGGMGSPDYQSAGGGQIGAYDVNSLRSYLPQDSPRTNGIRNNSMQGAVVGAPGTLPTNWVQAEGAGWNVIAVVNTGTINGMDFIDLLYSGNPTGANASISFDGTQIIAAANGQTWTWSCFLQIIAGSLANINHVTLQINNRTVTGAATGILETFNVEGLLGSTALNRLALTATLNDATVAFVQPQINLNAAAGGLPVNLTLRLAWPQLEQGAFATSPIRTVGAAVTRTIGAVRQPDLKSPPNVVSIAGFGSSGAGAFILNNGSDADQSQGLVAINVGLAPASSGTIVLRFPIAPVAGQYVVAGEWLATATLGVAGNNLTITWAANRPLIPNEDLVLAYQWATST